jgi:hypothetical protein
MKYVSRSLVFSGFLSLTVVLLIPARTFASSNEKLVAVTDRLHTPAEGSAERAAILEGLRRHWQTSRNPNDGKNYKGKITFRVNYLKVHHGWAWVYAEPRSSLATEGFPENSGFLLHMKSSRWEVMKLPRMDDNGDGAFNPSPADLERIRKMYPSVAPDIIPIEKRR